MAAESLPHETRDLYISDALMPSRDQKKNQLESSDDRGAKTDRGVWEEVAHWGGSCFLTWKDRQSQRSVMSRHGLLSSSSQEEWTGVTMDPRCWAEEIRQQAKEAYGGKRKVFLDVARGLSLLATFADFVALLSEWDLHNRFVNFDISKDLVSCLANFHTGVFLLGTLLIVYLKLRTEVDVTGNQLWLFCGFYMGCIVCLLSFVLGTQAMIEHKSSEEEKMNTERHLEEV
ncbi:uncharacterized protein LOC144584329 [Pogona vitticeps]